MRDDCKAADELTTSIRITGTGSKKIYMRVGRWCVVEPIVWLLKLRTGIHLLR